MLDSAANVGGDLFVVHGGFFLSRALLLGMAVLCAIFKRIPSITTTIF